MQLENKGRSDRNLFCSSDHADMVLGRTKLHRDSEQFCDVVLVADIDGKRVPAHRLILASCSDYFSAMFCGSLREAKQNEVKLGEVHGDDLKALVNFCYTGCLDMHKDNVESLLTTANLLQLESVIAGCTNFLASQLDPSNSLGIALFAAQHSFGKLLSRAEAYICQHFTEVCKTQEFLRLNVEQLIKLLSSDELEVPSEENVFECLMCWVLYDEPARKAHIAELMELVRIPLLQPCYIRDNVESVCKANGCMQLVLEAYKWHLMPESRSFFNDKRTTPRIKFDYLLAIGSECNFGNVNIERYYPRLKQWKKYSLNRKEWKELLMEQTLKRREFGAALMKDKLIIVGGRNAIDGQIVSSVESLDINSMSCTSLPPMLTSRKLLGVAVLKGFIYAVGGWQGGQALSSVERFDTEKRTWANVTPMSTKRCDAGVVVLNDLLYVIGGYTDNSALASTERYDPKTNKWTVMASMNAPRAGAGVSQLNGIIYALGGYTELSVRVRGSNFFDPSMSRNFAMGELSSVERYDPVINKWTRVCSLSSARYGIGCAQLDNRLIAVGGEPVSTVEEYDPECDKWIKFEPLNSPQFRTYVFYIPKNINNNVL